METMGNYGFGDGTMTYYGKNLSLLMPKFFSVARSRQSNSPVSAIIPLDSIVCSCYLTPKFGMTYHPGKWTSAEVLEECKSFTFNKYITSAMFYNLEKY